MNRVGIEGRGESIWVAYAFGALVHYGNLAGLSEVTWAEMSRALRIGDVSYALLDTAAVFGLWLGRGWGVLCFLTAAMSQLVLYGVFADVFVSTPQQAGKVSGLVGSHVVTLLLYGVSEP